MGIVFLGGPNLDTLYRVTLKGTNRKVYHEKMHNIMRNLGAPYSIIFLMDTVKEENDQGDWYIYNLNDTCKTPDWLIDHCKVAHGMVAEYYAEEDEMVKQSRENTQYQQQSYQAPAQEPTQEDIDKGTAPPAGCPDPEPDQSQGAKLPDPPMGEPPF